MSKGKKKTRNRLENITIGKLRETVNGKISNNGGSNLRKLTFLKCKLPSETVAQYCRNMGVSEATWYSYNTRVDNDEFNNFSIRPEDISKHREILMAYFKANKKRKKKEIIEILMIKYEHDYNNAELAKIYNVHQNSVSSWVRKYGAEARKQLHHKKGDITQINKPLEKVEMTMSGKPKTVDSLDVYDLCKAQLSKLDKSKQSRVMEMLIDDFSD